MAEAVDPGIISGYHAHLYYAVETRPAQSGCEPPSGRISRRLGSGAGMTNRSGLIP